MMRYIYFTIYITSQTQICYAPSYADIGCESLQTLRQT